MCRAHRNMPIVKQMWRRLLSRQLLAVLVGAALALSCGSAVRRRSSIDAETTSAKLRVVHMDPFEMFQLTSSPFRQSIVTDVLDDPTGTIRVSRLKLKILFGSAQEAPFIRHTEGGNVLDESVLAPGAIVTVVLPLGTATKCPAPVSPVDGRYLDQDTADRYDDLPCFEVEAHALGLVRGGQAPTDAASQRGSENKVRCASPRSPSGA